MELASISSFYVSLLRIGGWRMLVGGKPATSDNDTFPLHGGDDIASPLHGGSKLPATTKGTGTIVNILKEIPMKLLEHAAYGYALHTVEGIAPSL